MNLVRSEIRTGLLVLITIGVLVAVLMLVGAPGVFTPMNTYHVFFDNAGGLRPGAVVQLAGRKVGTVQKLYSPVPASQRPKDMPKAEVLVEIQVERSAHIYRNVRVSMQQPTLLGEMLIDFSNGVEESGLAPENAFFIGERAPGLSEAVPTILAKIDPVIQKATDTLQELQNTAGNLNKITAAESDFNEMISRFRELGDNLVQLSGPESKLQGTLTHLDTLTGPDSSLQKSLANIDAVTSDLAENRRVEKMINKFDSAAQNIQQVSVGLNQAVTDIQQPLSDTLTNTSQLTDTLKRQPWRLVWPSTKSYEEDIPVRRAIPVDDPVVLPRLRPYR